MTCRWRIANVCQFTPHSLRMPFLIQCRYARSRYPFYPCYCYACPYVGSGRHPFCGRGVRSRQASTANPESFPAAGTESSNNRSFRRRFVLLVHAACPPDPFCNRPETLDPIESSPSFKKEKARHSLLSKTRAKARSKGTAYGEFSPPSIKCAISADLGQNGRGFSADLNRLTAEFCMLGRKRTGFSIWFLSHARTAVHTIRLLPNSFRDESTILCSFGNSNAVVRRAVSGTLPHQPSRLLPSQESAAGCPPPDGCAP